MLVIFCGIPSIGKTLIARRLAIELEGNDGSTFVVGSDDIRHLIPAHEESFEPEREAFIREITLHLIDFLLKKGKNVISDDTNYYNAMRRDLIEIAKRNKVEYAIVYVHAPIDYALKWNKERGEPIPPEVIQRIHDRFDIPGKKYKWDQPIAYIDTSKIQLEDAVKNIHQKIRDMKSRKKVKVKSSYYNSGKSEEIDRITRSIVGKIMAESGDKSLARRVSFLRKSFVREAVEKNLSPEEVESEFIKRIKSVVNSENL
ncbi:MAG: AAA family ATPase [Candidatus Jordarchaeum sp.]|uniref:AAA family ATPase n=1 Tax=Candidatus Jordarchaeum sp. TaxID=2823881 RepID=UPI00404B39E3